MKCLFKALVLACLLTWAVAQPGAAVSETHSALYIGYFGESTALVIPIVISDSSIDAERGRKEVLAEMKLHVDIARVFVVKPQEMAELLAEFRNLPNQTEEPPTPPNEALRRPYMVFHIVVMTPAGESRRVLDGRQTDAFLKSLASHSEEEVLREGLQKLQNWIEE